tara:strand:+ start:828 stop:1097 length:270 start_codon:yes stop_codon:yes gene_type:complete
MSCGTIKEGFQSQKNKNTDEFLVEKKSPLVMPPEFNELPIPKQQEEMKDLKDNEFKTLVTKDNLENKPDNNKDTNKSFEETILDKIKNN